MSDLSIDGIEIVNELVHGWTAKYAYLTKFLDKTDQIYRFQCEFSLPSPHLPIPKSTVKVFFFLEKKDKEILIKYRFENDSLIHLPEKTVTAYKMEVF